MKTEVAASNPKPKSAVSSLPNKSASPHAYRHIISEKTDKKKKRTCMDLKMLPYYMGGMELERVKPELYEQLLRFHEEYANVAWAAFRSQMTSDPEMLQEVDMFETHPKRHYYRVMDQAAELLQLIEDVENTVADLKPLVERVQQIYEGQADIETLACEIVGRLRLMDARLLVTEMINPNQVLLIRCYAKKLCIALDTVNHEQFHHGERYWAFRILSKMYKHFGVCSYLTMKASDFDAFVFYMRKLWEKEVGSEPPECLAHMNPTLLY